MDDVSISYRHLPDPPQPQGGSTQASQQGKCQGVKKIDEKEGEVGEGSLVLAQHANVRGHCCMIQEDLKRQQKCV